MTKVKKQAASLNALKIIAGYYALLGIMPLISTFLGPHAEIYLGNTYFNSVINILTPLPIEPSYSYYYLKVLCFVVIYFSIAYLIWKRNQIGLYIGIFMSLAVLFIQLAVVFSLGLVTYTNAFTSEKYLLVHLLLIIVIPVFLIKEILAKKVTLHSSGSTT